MLYGIEVIDIKLYVHIINSMALILLISVTLISFKYISQFLVFKLDWTRLEDGGGVIAAKFEKEKCVNLSCNCHNFKEMYGEQLKQKCMNL